MLEYKGRYTSAKVMIDSIEEECANQIMRMTSHVAFTNPIAIMPDTHAGKGSVIGFTMSLDIKVLPPVCGVDIGCGMLSQNFGSSLNMSLEQLDEQMRKRIPMGIETHSPSDNQKINGERFSFEKHFPFVYLNKELQDFTLAYNKKFGTNYIYKVFDYRDFISLCGKIGIDKKRAELSIGTLGGGNHFIESGLALNNDIWITVHSGSRNFGKCVCDYHEKMAKKVLDNKRNVQLKGQIEHITQNTEDKSQISKLIQDAKKNLGIDFEYDIHGMEFLEGQEAFNYLLDMVVAQVYAEFNRKTMMAITQDILQARPIEVIESVHNYIDFRDFIIRKGAIRSYLGEKMIIPFNMRDGILVCEGKSNPEWNFSAPHGAGRLMSRSKAKQTIELETFEKQMQGIYSTSVCKSTLDEAPDAYKDSKMIEAAIEPTATIIDRLKPLMNIKDKTSEGTWKERKEKNKSS